MKHEPISSKILEQIRANTVLLSEIELLVVKVTILSDNLRNKQFAGFFRNALSTFHAIDILIEKKLYNPAFSLIRVLFDNVVRALYMYNEFDDTQLSSDTWDKEFTTTKIMCEKLTNVYDNDFFEKVRIGAYSSMCDFTHVGVNQIARNFNEQNETIEANFSDDFILHALISCKGLVKTFAFEYFKAIGLKQGEITSDEIKEFYYKYV